MQVWWQICSLSTIVREYVALRSISSLPFKDLILAASERNYTSEDQAWEIPRPLMESIESNHNKSQLDAIRVSPCSIYVFFLLNLALIPLQPNPLLYSCNTSTLPSFYATFVSLFKKQAVSHKITWFCFCPLHCVKLENGIFCNAGRCFS